MRVVLDSNVFISGLMLPQSIPGKILSAWGGGQFDLVLSEPMLGEISRVLSYPKISRRIGWDDEKIARYALRGGNCPNWIVPSGMQCKAQIAPRGFSHASNLQRGSAPAGGNQIGQLPPRKAYIALLRFEAAIVSIEGIAADVPGDPNDSPILATLLASKADCLVSGDDHLLCLAGEYPICSSAEFVSRIFHA